MANFKEINEIFNELNSINVNDLTKKKGNFTYLSWAWAVRELLKVDPQATWEVHEWGLEGSKQPYMQTEAGCFVQVTVWSGGIARTQVHPVLDNRNKTIEKPNAFEINTSIQRCLAKAIALHGLGLYIFAGEDLPTPPEPPTKKEVAELIKLAFLISEEKAGEINLLVEDGTINSSNYNASMSKLKRLANK